LNPSGPSRSRAQHHLLLPRLELATRPVEQLGPVDEDLEARDGALLSFDRRCCEPDHAVSSFDLFAASSAA
jgi:hypothetical protein